MFIRNNRRRRIVSTFIGVFIVAIPSCFIVAYCICHMNNYKQQLSKIKAETQGYEEVSVYVALRDVEKGEKISENDVRKLKLRLMDKKPYQFKQSMLESDLINFDDSVITHSVKGGDIITSSMTINQREFENDLRIHEFSGIQISSNAEKGCYVDIRIMLPDGEDFIIAGHKEVVGIKDGNLLLYVTEEEILKMSSAYVDFSKYEDVNIYTTVYASDYQKSAIPDYPANIQVCQLGSWDPNLLQKVFTEEILSNRNNLDSNLINYRKE